VSVRRVRISPDLLADAITLGSHCHYIVSRGVPAGARLISSETDGMLVTLTFDYDYEWPFGEGDIEVRASRCPPECNGQG